jgi:EAL domain-containing protein (putative c-di-GMP-specific phosphodiesterase class I)
LASNRLLVIDDAPASSATIGRVARGCGFDTIITTDADDFRSRIRLWNPTVVVLDLAMPEMDGHQLMEWLALQGCQSRILIVSGREIEELREAEAAGRALGLNMAGSLHKPLRLETLRGVFREIYNNAGVISIRDIAEALIHREFRLEYQPKLDLRSGDIVGFEALARWTHPKLGQVSPSTFIPVLESDSIMNDFTIEVLDQALDGMSRMGDGSEIRVAVNASATNFRLAGFDEIVRSKCYDKGIDIGRMTIEVTESEAMTATGSSGACLERLHGYGAQISIDDFGTGYSSLSKLHHLPFSELKIDQSFVADCVSNRKSAVLVLAMIDLAHNMNKRVVAEGVETRQTLQKLSEWGCDIVQGYYVGRPMPFEDVKPWLRRQAAFAGDDGFRLADR